MHRGFLLITLAFLLVAVSVSGFYFYLNPKAWENLPFNFSFQIFPPKEEDNLISSTPVTSEPVSLPLTISSPDNNLLVLDNELLISGKTSPNAFVILSLDEEDKVIDVETSGNFSDTAKVKEGVNYLIITTFDKDGRSKSESRTIYYSKEKM